jgi:hypothetical protein
MKRALPVVIVLTAAAEHEPRETGELDSDISTLASIAMSDDDDQMKSSVERWRAKIEAGEPIMEFYIDEPLTIGITDEGEVALKFVFGQLANIEIASLALAILSPAAAQRLKATLAALENIPDTLPPTREPRSRN